MKNDNDKKTKDMLVNAPYGLEISYGYFDKRWCRECEEYRYFYDVKIIDGKRLVKCSHCFNALFVQE